MGERGDATIITPLRIWRQTATIDNSFAVHKTATDLESQKVAVQNQEELGMANETCNGYQWSVYPEYERTSSFFSMSQKAPVERGPSSGKTVWADVHDAFFKFVNGPKLSTATVENTFKVAADCLRVTKKVCAEIVMPVVMLTLPRRDRAWGQCPVLPAGLPLLQSQDTNDAPLKSLTSTLDKAKVS